MIAPPSIVIYNILKEEKESQCCTAGQTIFEEGQLGSHMYAIIEGEVEILFHGQVINRLGQGDIFGEMALIDTNIRSATAIAKTDCQLVSIDEKRFDYLVHLSPAFALAIMRILAERLRRRTES